MAIDLVDLVSRSLAPPSVSGLARAGGIAEPVAQRLVTAAIPTVLASLATTAAAPGSAQKIADAVSNSDPDLLTKLASALGSGDVRALNESAGLLGGLLGGSSLSSLVGALSQYAGASPAAAQTTVGAVVQAAIGTIGQQDPSVWSDGKSIAAMLGSQKDAIAAALPGELKRALSATGLLAGLGSLSAVPRSAASASSAARAAASAASARTGPPASRTQAPSRARGFPIWAIIVLIVIVLVLIWWFVARRPEPAKQGMLPARAEVALLQSPETWICVWGACS